jgi:hypothetical protein
MPRERCLITARLAGPCATCRQPAWPAHAWPDGRILCGNCCPCARRNAAPGRAAAGHAHDAGPVMPREAGPGHDALAAHREPPKNKPRIGLPAGAGASQAWGKAPDTSQGPARDSGALEALRGPLCAAIRAALPWPSSKRPAWPLRPRSAFRPPAACRPPRCSAGRGPGHNAARHGRPARGLGHASLRRALAAKTFLRRNVPAQNFTKNWRFA